ncbi:MAG: putative lipid II flippase FtsW [Spirochaetales bacterium]|nr:putative lipid II flippase FtsW [Spirochaetales bacterium]
MKAPRFGLEKGVKPTTDLMLLTLLVFLPLLGLVVLFSASYFKGETLANNPWFFVQRQAVLLVVGAFVAWFLSHVSWESVRKAVPILLLANFILMLAVFLPIWDVGTVLGARRWIVKFGFSFQPSELAKLTVVLYLASMFAKKQNELDDWKHSLLPPFAFSFLFVLLTLLQNDYSTSMFILFVILVMFFLAGVKLRYFVIVLALAGVLGVIGVLSAPYRMERFTSFLKPDHDVSGASYQITASRAALTDGGFWGKGFGAGTHKLGGIPEVHNDFIFAAFAEETGYWGVLAIFLLFGLLAWRAWSCALAHPDPFARMAGVGITVFLTYQMLINTAVVVGAVPATGVTFPFFSYGGSSIVVSLAMGGLLLNLSRRSSEVAA